MPNLAKETCPICELDNTESKPYADRRNIITYNCARCGRFLLSSSIKRSQKIQTVRSKLSAWIRERDIRGADIPDIHSGNLDEILGRLPDYKPRDKMSIFFQNLERISEYPGYQISVNPFFDYPLAWANSVEEFLHYLSSLIDRGLIKTADDSLPNKDFPSDVIITANGWDYLEELDRRSEEKTQVFVAMSFTGKMKPIWENAIEPAITKAGYDPYRVDIEPHIDRIDAKIIAEIKNSRFVVADVTEQKRGVYFEAGYALGMNLPVIWTVREYDLDNVHFDTRQYNHIVWKSEEELREKLFNVICAVIGKVSDS